MKWIAIASIAAALGIGYFAWQTHGALQETRVEVRSVKAQLTQAQAELRKAHTEMEAARQEASSAKLAADQLRVEANSNRVFLDAERAMNLKLREDMAMLQQRLLSGGRGAPPPSPALALPPMLVRPQPVGVRALPTPVPQSAAQPAR